MGLRLWYGKTQCNENLPGTSPGIDLLVQTWARWSRNARNQLHSQGFSLGKKKPWNAVSHLKSNRWGVGVEGESVFPWSQQNFPLGVPCSLKYQKLKQSLAFVPTNPALLFPIIFVTMFSQSLKPLGKSQYITLKIKRGYIFYIVTNSPLPTQELFGLIATVLVFVYYLFNKCMKKILDKRLATSSNPPTVHSECKIRTKWVTRMQITTKISEVSPKNRGERKLFSKVIRGIPKITEASEHYPRREDHPKMDRRFLKISET